jgi:hypothetical protein
MNQNSLILERLSTSPLRLQKGLPLRYYAGLLVLLVLSGNSAGSAQSFDAKGTLTYKVFDEHQRLRFDKTFRFSMTMEGNKWTVVSKPVRDLDLEPVSSFNTYSDGTNTYSVSILNPTYNKAKGISNFLANYNIDSNALVKSAPSKIDQLILKKLLDTNQITTQNRAVGSIYPGAVPRFGPDFAALVWLAYGSSSYFEAPTESKAPRMWFYDYPEQAVDDYMELAKWKLCDTEPHLPQLIEFYSDGTYGRADNHNRHTRIYYPPPYNREFTNAIFKAMSFTNCEGKVFPFSFNLSGYVPTTNADGTAWLKIAGTIEGRTEEIHNHPNNFGRAGQTGLEEALSPFTPIISLNTAIVDYRFSAHNGGYLQYLAPSNCILGGTNLHELTRFQDAIRAKNKSKNAKNDDKILARKRLIVAVMGFLLVAFGVLVVRTARRT